MTQRVTVSLSDDLAAAARTAVETGQADSVSGWIADAIAARVSRERDLARLTRVMGGPPPPEVLAEARRRAGLPDASGPAA